MPRPRDRHAGAPVDDDWLDLFACLLVDDHHPAMLWRNRIIGPAGQRHDDSCHTTSALGQHVLMAKRARRVRPPLQHTIGDKCREPLREHRRRDVEVPTEVLEAGDPQHRVTHDQDRPPLPDCVNTPPNRTRPVAQTGSLSHYINGSNSGTRRRTRQRSCRRASALVSVSEGSRESASDPRGPRRSSPRLRAGGLVTRPAPVEPGCDTAGKHELDVVAGRRRSPAPGADADLMAMGVLPLANSGAGAHDACAECWQ